MKRLIIGDIHGCYSEFQELLSKAGLSEEDEIIATGDIIDRGPDSPKLLNYFNNHPNAYSVMGNHEHKHILSLLVQRFIRCRDFIQQIRGFTWNYRFSIKQV